MAVSFTVLKGTNIPKEWLRRQVNPYCLIEYKDVKLQTRVLSGAANPEWNETLEIDLMGKPLDHFGVVLLYLKDHSTFGVDRIIGQAAIPVRTIITKRQATLNVNLGDDAQRPTSINSSVATVARSTPAFSHFGLLKNAASDRRCEELSPPAWSSMLLSLIVRYEPPGFSRESLLLRSTFDRRSYSSSRRSSLSSLNSSTVIAPVTAAVAAAPLPERSEASAVSDAIVQTDELDEFGISDVATQQSFRTKSLSMLPQDFQVRVKVVCAKKLEGADIYPLCKITLLRQQRQTRIRKSTNAPAWNEVFNFTTRMAPSELVHESISFEVYDSRTLRRNSLIGCFKSELSVIYSRENRSAINKWLVLADRDDDNCSVKGYLMVCVCILERGDSAPTFNPSSAAEDDVEANLLVPEGFSLQPATLVLRVYKGEDLPRLDSAFLESVRKLYNLVNAPITDGVDPYVTATYAGKKVQTKIVFENKNPVWNQELLIGFKFPSVTDNLQISIIDWSQVVEDVLCTTRICTASMSRTGSNGFLPTLGPCYINLYASKCEQGKGEQRHVDGDCVGYRGRLFMEMSTKLEAIAGQQVVDIPHDDVLRVEKHMKRHKYALYATFLNATMLSKTTDPVQFGISIGPYGNESGSTYSAAHVTSMTSAVNAVFDDCEYHYVSWDENKPCIALGSWWEDVSFRTDATNMLISIACLMDEGIRTIRIALKAKVGADEISEICRIVLTNIVRECCAPLPRPDEHQSTTELDEHLYNIRSDELKTIAEEAARLKVSSASAELILHAVEQFLKILRDLISDPQSSIPDVFVWMAVGGSRCAYTRVPAHELLYSERGYSGRRCGKTQTLLLKSTCSGGSEGERAPAKVQVNIWLGRQENESHWQDGLDATLAVVAEVYENQALLAGRWHSNTSIMQQRYPWSDEAGAVELQKSKFQPPSGWVWDGEWRAVNAAPTSVPVPQEAPEQRIEEVFEVQCRNNEGEDWLPDSLWVNVDNSAATPKDEITLSDGWIWVNDWEVNHERAVDDEGWEYCERLADGDYSSVSTSQHVFRRRKWQRTYSCGVPPEQAATEQAETEQITAQPALDAAVPTASGWEYATSFKDKFHPEQRTADTVRRRRWQRNMSSFDGTNDVCVFSSPCPDVKAPLTRQSSILSKKETPPAPRIYAKIKGSGVYQLKAYIYQARDLLASNDNGLSDPYAVVCFDTQSQKTNIQRKTLSPLWDQTLVFNGTRLWGTEADVSAQPPDVCIEVYSDDLLGRRRFLGQAQARPKVRLTSASNGSEPAVLEWITLYRGYDDCGELLASFELIKVDLDNEQQETSTEALTCQLTVPVSVRPVLQRTAIEVLAWGVRNLKSYQLIPINSPCIQVEVGGVAVCSSVINNARVNPNFVPPFIFIETMLPQEPYFMPPINIRMYDQRSFGIRPVVGTHVIKSIDRYRVATPESRPEEAEESSRRSSFLDKRRSVPIGPSFFSITTRSSSIETFESTETSGTYSTELSEVAEDWWSKYYASLSDVGEDAVRKYQPACPENVKIYHSELEKVENFNEFTDFCETFPLTSCSSGFPSGSDEYEVVGELKGTFRIYSLPDDRTKPLPPRVLRDLPSSERQECVVRLYVVSATDLQPGPRNGLANPYVVAELGKQKFDTRDSYVNNALNPTFGRVFEFVATLPMEKDLRVTVMDYDAVNFDEPIGQTVIDLEDRLFTKHRGTCGLPRNYYTSGPHVWRDSQRPTQILRHVCYLRGLSSPDYSGASAVQVGSKMYFLSDFEAGQGRRPHQGSPKERLALHVLNTMDLVKEHVETRALHHPLQPSFERGKLQCWVDIFPKQNGEPGPAWNITPRSPKSYFLRCVVWNVMDIPPAARGILTERSRDVYVKGWIVGSEPQKTDVHYRAIDGAGNFNWRFVFPFQYLPIEQLLVANAKENIWSLKEKQERVKPSLTLQLWDNDLIAAGDCLGMVTLDLLQLPKPTKARRACDLQTLPEFSKDAATFSLFEQKRVRGFWPCYVIKNGIPHMTGKIDLELEVLTAEQAAERPAGQGRGDPNINPYLEPPRRPETSFLWLVSPVKTAKHIVWPQNKRDSI